MKILVTGGVGFVGINLVRWLAEELPAAEVLAGDILAPEAAAAAFLAPVAARARVLRLDVTDREALARLVRDERVTHLVHAAAATPGEERERAAPTSIVDLNLGGAVNALAVAAAAPGVERALLLSSSGVYGPPLDARAPCREDAPLQLDNLYAITKHSAELLGARYGALSGKPIASLRLASVYGPMERPTGSRQAMSVPRRLMAALRSGRPVRVFGAQYRRDWLFAEDAARAVGALLLAPRLGHSVYNVGGGAAAPLRELVDAFVAHGLRALWADAPDDAEIAVGPSTARAPLCNARIQADAGYTPRYSLAAGVGRYVASSTEETFL
jgi:nucleoside-diphosphate-sugar epimerase